MDPERFKEAWTKLESLDDRLTYKIRSHSGPPRSSPSLDQVDQRTRELAHYTLELKSILRELFLSLGTRSGTGP